MSQGDAERARAELVWLLDRRVRGLALLRTIARRRYDASVILHLLGKTECTTAMKNANEYLAAAQTQMDRIDAAMNEWTSLRNRARVFREIHFYFICWHAVWERLELIKDITGWRSLKRALRPYREEADDFIRGRDWLEHYEEWLSGKPRRKPLAEWDHGNLFGRTFTLAGYKYDVSRANLKRLERLVAKFSEAVEEEGIERLYVREMTRED